MLSNKGNRFQQTQEGVWLLVTPPAAPRSPAPDPLGTARLAQPHACPRTVATPRWGHRGKGRGDLSDAAQGQSAWPVSRHEAVATGRAAPGTEGHLPGSGRNSAASAAVLPPRLFAEGRVQTVGRGEGRDGGHSKQAPRSPCSRPETPGQGNPVPLGSCVARSVQGTTLVNSVGTGLSAVTVLPLPEVEIRASDPRKPNQAA